MQYYKIALTKEEFKKIENVKLSSEKLDKIRDIFLMINYTCLHFGDYLNLDITNFDFQNKVIKINQGKKEQLVEIPIHKKITKLLQKYPDNNYYP